MSNTNPYEKCPIYESKNFILRLVEENDAENLFKCYSDLSAVKFMNSDNCTSDFHFTTINEVKNCIFIWLREYENKGYVRFSIEDKQNCKAIGTIEMFGRKDADGKITGYGVLRIDLCSNYEKHSYITELLEISNKHFYDVFGVKQIITKAISTATERILALIENGFLKLENNIIPYGDYYIKRKA